MKKETLRQVLGEASHAENLYFLVRPRNVNIWVSFSRSEVQPGEEIPSR